MKSALNLPFLPLFPITLFLIHGFQQTLLVVAQNETSDKLALLAFKNQIEEDPLGILSSWNESIHFCNWTGVSCSQRHEGRVTALNLPNLNLVGSITQELGNISFLRQINLAHNNFKANIPQELGNLFRLRYLNISRNAFHGQIPKTLGLCSEIEVIDLGNNGLIGDIPTELGNISKTLIFFTVYSNQLTGSIPQWLGNASLLTDLSLGRNQFLGGIPDELGRLQNLQQLQLTGGNLSGEFPVSIFNISSLTYLSLAENKLHGRFPANIGSTLPHLQYLAAGANFFHGKIPASLVNLSRLQVLNLPINNLTGPIPSNLGLLQNLETLSLSYNQLEVPTDEGLDFLGSLTNCTNLRWLDLGTNRLQGELPASIANFSSKLEILFLGSNQISGKIPFGIGNLVGLTWMQLGATLISGEIPPSIGKLGKLARLYLFSSRLLGSIPSELGNLTQLQELSLMGNDLSGEIPSSLGNCLQLKYVFLDNNSLTGNIPGELLRLRAMQILSMPGNSFSGPLPPEVGNMTSLVGLLVSHNKLSGEIPSSLGNCLMLQGLWMQDNLLEGTIPLSFTNLKNLEELHLSRNNLSGQIPNYFQNFTLLQKLNLSFNNFEGEVPDDGIFRNVSIVSVAGNQRLCGGIRQLQLPPCKTQKSESNKKIMVILVSVLCSTFLIVTLVVIFLCRKKSKRKVSTKKEEEEEELFPKVSYAALSQATNEFSVSNLLGKGSFGSVYEGFLGEKRLPVAVKVLNLEQKGASKSFIAECEALSNIRHRNLIKIMTVCSSIDSKGADFKAIVYELMQNGSLEDWLHPRDNDQVRSSRFSFIQILNTSIEVASAIEYLHYYCEPAIVHGDLKPSNILLDNDMVAHVGDFGLSILLNKSANGNATSHEQISITSSIGVKGTIGYVAPEYGMGSKSSMAGDVYSFGILLLEMIIGKRPTDPMFEDGLSIHHYVKTALPERVMEILEPSLLHEVQETDYGIQSSEAMNEGENVGVLDGLVEVARIGILCSMESPSERMEMKQVVAQLTTIKENFLMTRNVTNSPK